MARFILDVANIENNTKEFMDEFIEKLSDKVATITCIDKSNDNQFYDDNDGHGYVDNMITKKQIENYKQQLIKLDGGVSKCTHGK